MPADLVTLLTVAAVVVTGLFGLLCTVTVVSSFRAWRTEQRRSAARKRVRGEFFTRRARDDPAWESWIAELSDREREELVAVVERYLRTVSGSERAVYLEIARALEMGERANEALDQQATLPRLRALARLTLLEYPVTEQRLLETCLDDRDTREAAARLLYERQDEFEEARSLGTAFLVWDGRDPMTARGMETLYDLNQENPVTLLSQGYWASHRWDTTVLVQVCTVLSACQTSATVERFEWVFPLFEAEDPEIRAATIRLFGGIGWREDLREHIPFRELITDPSARVRRATYQVLARWDDDRARGLLQWAVIDERDARAQLLAVRALAVLDRTLEPGDDRPGWPDEAWAWVRAELDAAGHAELPTRGVLA